MMTKRDKIFNVSKVCGLIERYNQQCKIAYDSVGFSSESNLGCVVSGIVDMVIESTSIAIGDKNDYLTWFVYENDLGRGNNQVFIESVPFECKTVHNLIDIIEALSDK